MIDLETTETTETPEHETALADETVPDWLIPDDVYDVLKWIGLIVLPACAVFVQTVGTAAGWPGVDLTVTILTALGTLIGVIIGASALKARS